MEHKLNKVYILNPGYVLRNDVARSVLATRDNNSFHYLDVDDLTTIIHPVLAMLLSFFTKGEKNLKDTLLEISEYFDVSYDSVYRIVHRLLDNDSDVAVKYDGTISSFPDRLLIEQSGEKRTESYRPEEFLVDRDVDMIHERLYKPLYASFLVSNKCVTDCIYCYADKRRLYDCTIPFQRLQELIGEAKSEGIISFDIQGGELFLYKDWEKLLIALYEAGYSVYMSTKYPLSAWEVERLKSTGTKEIQISLDSIDRDDLMTNLRVGPGYKDRILKSIELLDKAGMRIKIKGVITGPIFNYQRVKDYIDYFDKYAGVEVVELTAPAHSLYKTEEEFAKYRLNEQQLLSLLELAAKEKYRHHFELRTDITSSERGLSASEKKEIFSHRSRCSGNMTSFMILPNGDVTYCEETYFNPHFILGNILHTSILDVWSSQKAYNMFYLPQSAFPKESPCSLCKEFISCRYQRGICWTEVMEAYGDENMMFPSPYCPYAPDPKNDILIW